MLPVVMLIVGLLAGAGIGYLVRKSLSESRAGAIEVRAREMLAAAERDAVAAKSQALVEAKDEAIRIRQEAEADARARYVGVQRPESRLSQKEETLDEMSRRLEGRERSLLDRAAETERIRAQVEEVLREQQTELERLAGMTAASPAHSVWPYISVRLIPSAMNQRINSPETAAPPTKARRSRSSPSSRRTLPSTSPCSSHASSAVQGGDRRPASRRSACRPPAAIPHRYQTHSGYPGG